jgi:nitrite reductase/ring-hydroxylating ferredoxin subunit
VTGSAGDETGWTDVLSETDLPEGRSVKVVVDGVDVFLYRTSERWFALADRCTHMGGPLHRGAVSAMGSRLTVTCPFHGSRFMLEDGRVIRGPATRPQQVYDVRIREGRVEVRPATR